jgi:hypothetical protein
MDIKIVKFKVRRGTNNQRKATIFDQGELVHTLDNKRLYVGNGVLSGGEVIGNKNFTPLNQISDLLTTDAEVGDLVPINSIFYQLTATPASNSSNWVPLSSDVVSNIGLSALSASLINPLTVSNGIKIQNNILQSNINSKSLEISAFQISIKPSGIDEREISSTSFGNGIGGGDNSKISLTVDSSYFEFNSGVLTLNSTLVDTLSDAITEVDGLTITNADGIISQTEITTEQTQEMSLVSVDEYGRVVDLDSSIYDTLTGFDTINTIFNGTPSHSLSGGIAGLNITVLSALSAFVTGVDEFDDEIFETVLITLSSAGFLTFEGNTESRTGQPVGRYAIPIFTY